MRKTLRPDFAANRRAQEPRVLQSDGQATREPSSRSARRKRRLERRRMREEQSSLVLAAANAFVAFDDAGVISDWNGQSEALFGWTKGEAIGRKLAPLILAPDQHPTHRPGLDAFLDVRDRLQAPGRIELRAVRRDGHRFVVEMSIFTFKIDDTPQFAAFFTDITSRLNADEQMRHHDSVLRAVLEDSPDIVFVKDLDLRFVVANRTAARILGQPVERLVGRTMLDFMPRATARYLEENDRMVIRFGRPLVFEEVLPTPEGDRWFLVTRSAYRNHRGDVCGVICRGFDTTARYQCKQQGAKLERELLERMKETVVGLSYGTLGASLMLDANDRYIHVFGRARNEMVGLETASMPVFADELDRTRMTTQLGRTGAFPTSHVTFVRKDGTLAPTLFALRLVEIRKRLVWVAIAIDARSGEPIRREMAKIEELAARLSALSLG